MAADIFRILSRSTKLTKDKIDTGQTTRPSAGGRDSLPRTNDTQKHPSRPSTLTGKRKRGHTTPERSNAIGLNFFETSIETPVQDREDGSAIQSDGADALSISNQQTPVWTEEQCKRELLKHKIKVTVLEDWGQTTAHIHKRNGSSSRQKIKKGHKRQMYPQPLQSFAELAPRYHLSQRLLENINAQGYTLPTEVQLSAIPLLLERSSGTPDLLSVAPTGSGKTLAFMIPTVDSILRARNQADPSGTTRSDDPNAEDGPLAIILAPTKELASQILNEGRKLTQHTGVKITMMKKGMTVVDSVDLRPSYLEASVDGDSLLDDHSDAEPSSTDASRTRVKSHILVSTPLVLLHAITRADGTTTPLSTVRRLILDEADVLLDPLFREQVLAIWNACSHLDIRVSMWSATMGSNIEALAQETIAKRHSALTLQSPATKTPLLRLVIGLKDSALPNVHHKLVYAASEAGKLMAVRQFLRPTAPSSRSHEAPLLDDISSLQPPFLIFTQTVPRANALAAELKYDIPPSAGGGSRIAALHANMSDSARDEVMAGFRKGEIWVLVTTDLLARGVDFRGVNGVVNYDVPTSAASYVHRAGRTGRAGREGGIAMTLYADEDVPFLKPIANVIAMSEATSGETPKSSHGWLLDSLPTPTKREKKLLKRRGIEERRPGREKAKISTKSGFVRRMEQRKRDAREASARRGGSRERNGHNNGLQPATDEFEGFGD